MKKDKYSEFACEFKNEAVCEEELEEEGLEMSEIQKAHYKEDEEL